MSNISNSLHTFAILAYKESPFLEECILSLKKQTIESKLEMFTSTPSFFLTEISEKHRIPLWINKNKEGITSDWNFAYNHSTTKYVTLAHQDDVYLPKYTELCLKQIRTNPKNENLIVFTRCGEIINTTVRTFRLHLFIKDLLLLPFLFQRNISSVLIKKLMLSLGNPVPCPTVMYHKNKIEDFAFSNDFSCNMDWDAWLRLSSIKGSFSYVNENLVLHRISEDSQTYRQIKKNVRQREDELIFSRIWPSPVAKFLSKVYSLSTKFSQTK